MAAIGKIISGIINGVQKTSEALGKVEGALGRVLEYYEKQWETYDDAIVNLARNAGLSEERYKALNQELLLTATKVDESGMNFIQKYGKSTSDLVKMTNDYQQAIGRNISLTDDQLGKYAALGEVLGTTGTKIAQQFMNFGIDISTTEKLMSEVMNQTVEDGVRLDKVTENISNNYAKMASYTFENGIRGFTAMAEKAAKVNISMEQAFNFASRISGITSAIEVGSKLQVLGGQFSSLSNPLEMFYEATSDVGALQDRMINMFKGMGNYNTETGQVELSRFNKMRVQEAAGAMGISADEVLKMINTSAMKDEINRQLGAGNGLSDKEREFVQNTATINDKGQAVVQLNGEEKKVSELTPAEVKLLQGLSNTATTAQSINQIAMDVHTIAEAKDMQSAATAAEAQLDFTRNPGEIIDNLGQYVKGALAGLGDVLGPGIISNITDALGTGANFAFDKVGNVVQWGNEKIAGLTSRAGASIQNTLASNNHLTAVQRQQLQGIGQALASVGDIAKNGGSVQDIDRVVRQRIIASPVVAKGMEIRDIISAMTSQTLSVRDQAVLDAMHGKAHAEGGPISIPETVPHAFGGWVLPGLEHGGLLEGQRGVEQPITREFHSDGTMFENTAAGHEYVVREEATKNSYDAISTINANPTTSFAAVPITDTHKDGGDVIKPHAEGGDIEIREKPITETALPSFNESITSMHNVGGKIDFGEGTMNINIGNTSRKVDFPMDKIKSIIADYFNQYTREHGVRPAEVLA